MTDTPDSLGMNDAHVRAPRRAEQALLAVQDAPLPSVEDATAVVVVGNGAAGAAARAVVAVAASCAAVPFVAVTDAFLPAWVARCSLVVVIDHGEGSARTTALIEEAAARGASLIAVGVDDHVLDRARAVGGTTVALETGTGVARAAMIPLCTAALVTIDRLGFVPGVEHALDEAIRQLHRRGSELAAPGNRAHAIARRIGRRIPLVCGADAVGRVAADWWKAQCNANAKVPAFASALPESAFDEITGWGQHGDVTRQVLTAVVLRHRSERPDVAEAVEAYVPLLEESVGSVEIVEAAGDGEIAVLFDLLYLGDAVSLALAAREGLDPGPAPSLGLL